MVFTVSRFATVTMEPHVKQTMDYVAAPMAGWAQDVLMVKLRYLCL